MKKKRIIITGLIFVSLIIFVNLIGLATILTTHIILKESQKKYIIFMLNYKTITQEKKRFLIWS